jgi:hypothetical protein
MTKLVNGFCDDFLTGDAAHDSDAMFEDRGNA